MLTKNFILSELSKNQFVTIKKNNVLIVCPFHEDRNPSLSISLVNGKVPIGTWFCFGCKASGNWNVLAQKLGLKTVDKQNLESYYFINNEKINLYKPIDPNSLVLSKLDENWKKYNIKFLEQFNVKKLWHEKFKEYYLYFPFTFLGDYYGFIRAKLFSESIGPKYWFNVKEKLLYPIDYLFSFDVPVLVIVEGLSDALRLIKNKIPALAILGVSLTNFHYELLETLGVKKIIICLDGDKAGIRAVFGYTKEGKKYNGLTYSISKKNYEVRVLVPPKDKDPNNMPYKYIKILRHMILSIGGNLL